MRKTLPLIALVLFVGHNSFAQLSNGLVSQFYFTGGSLQNSVSTSSLSLTEDGFPATYGDDRDGNGNSALAFDGSSGDQQKLSIDDSNLELDLSSDFSISFWFKSNSLPTNDIQILFSSRQISSSNPGEKGGVDCYINTTGEFEVQFRPLGSGGQINGINTLKTTSINAGQWYHVTITKSGANVKHYINSAEQSNETITDYPNTNFPSVTYWNIGAFFNTQTDSIYRELNGDIDDIRLYSRSLTVQEVTSLYQETPPSLSLSENELNDIMLYPNPVNDVLNIQANDEKISYSLISITGKTIAQNTFDYNATIDVSALPSGVYFIEFNNGKNAQHRQKFIKQ